MNEKIVTNCYDLLALSLLIGIEDYTEGLYQGRRSTPYAEAQRNQHDYLLDQLGVTAGFRLLDVGCGTGSLLRRARERGAEATGITLSPRQVEIGRARGLDVRLLNYLDLGHQFSREFDGIVANGSIEHFCQPEQAACGRQDAIYEHMFEVFYRSLRPDSPVRKVVTTAIHFRGAPVPPEKVLRSPLRQPFDPKGFHFSILQRGYGGYYPAAGQLARCAQSRFRLVSEQEATQDYHFTSEDWSKIFRHALRDNAAFRARLAACFFRRPRHTVFFILSLLGAQSWPWQFRGTTPPTILYRHTWRARWQSWTGDDLPLPDLPIAAP